MGIITANDLQFLIGETKDNNDRIVFQIGDKCVVADKELNLPEQQIQALVFTKIGQELLQLIEATVELDYIQLLTLKIRRKGVTVKYATILEIKDEQIKNTGLIDVPATEEEIKGEEERLKKEEGKQKREEERKKQEEEKQRKIEQRNTEI